MSQWINMMNERIESNGDSPESRFRQIHSKYGKFTRKMCPNCSNSLTTKFTCISCANFQPNSLVFKFTRIWGSKMTSFQIHSPNSLLHPCPPFVCVCMCVCVISELVRLRIGACDTYPRLLFHFLPNVKGLTGKLETSLEICHTRSCLAVGLEKYYFNGFAETLTIAMQSVLYAPPHIWRRGARIFGVV